MPVIGFFHLTSLELTRELLAAFHRGLGDTGYIEGKNVAIEYRWAHGKNDLLPTLAAELVRRQVSVIVILEAHRVRSQPKRRPKLSRSFVCRLPTRSGLASSIVSTDLAEMSLASTSCWPNWLESALSYCSNWCRRPSRSLTSATRPTPFLPRAKGENCRLPRVLVEFTSCL